VEMFSYLICIAILFAESMNGLRYSYDTNKIFKSFVSYKRHENMALSSRKRNTNSPTAKGFKTTVIPSTEKVDNIETTTVSDKPAEVEPALEVQNAQDIFKKYGISDGEKSEVRKGKGNNKKKKATNQRSTEDLAPFGEEVMANMPMEVQQKFDNFLIAATFSSLTFVVLCGIGISVGAFKVAFKQVNIPPELDSLITNVFTPAFTPALGIFFLFSITFGLFKFAQISSSQTVYRED